VPRAPCLRRSFGRNRLGLECGQSEIASGGHDVSNDEAAIRGAPTFSELHDRLHDWTADEVVCRTHFNCISFSLACAAAASFRIRLPLARHRRRDALILARFSAMGYRWSSVTALLGITFEHRALRADAPHPPEGNGDE
jgi:hypothetical protein